MSPGNQPPGYCVRAETGPSTQRARREEKSTPLQTIDGRFNTKETYITGLSWAAIRQVDPLACPQES